MRAKQSSCEPMPIHTISVSCRIKKVTLPTFAKFTVGNLHAGIREKNVMAKCIYIIQGSYGFARTKFKDIQVHFKD